VDVGIFRTEWYSCPKKSNIQKTGWPCQATTHYFEVKNKKENKKVGVKIRKTKEESTHCLSTF
jgi:hypothetical protein